MRSVFLAALLFAPAALGAQAMPARGEAPAPLARGQRVRVHVGGARDEVRYVGILTSLDRDTLTLDNPPLSFVVSSIRRIERSRGFTARGLLIGFAVGGVAGGVAGWEYGGTRDTVSHDCLLGDTCHVSRRSNELLWGRIGVGVGALAGLLIGKAIYSERWEEVQLVPSLGWRPAGGPPALVLTARLPIPPLGRRPAGP